MRDILAPLVVVGGFVGIAAISSVAIWEAGDKDKTAQTVFSAVLPLLGTWVGAVLAFYFSRDNLEAANQATLNAVQAGRGVLDPDSPVLTVMIPFDGIQPKQVLTAPDGWKALRLRDLYKSMQDSGRSRVPVFLDASRTALYVVHEPDIDKYAQAKGVSSSALPDADTLELLVSDAALKAEVEGFVAVGPSATLGDARKALGQTATAKDLFVTENGAKDGRVVGWITNSDLVRAV